MAIPATPNQCGQGVSELRLTYGPGSGSTTHNVATAFVLLLCGGDNSTQGSDISKAHQFAADWLSNEDDHDR